MNFHLAQFLYFILIWLYFFLAKLVFMHWLNFFLSFSLVDNYLNCFKHEFQTIALNCASSEMQDFLVFISLMWEKRESWQGHLLIVRIFSENPIQNPKLLKKESKGEKERKKKTAEGVNNSCRQYDFFM